MNSRKMVNAQSRAGADTGIVDLGTLVDQLNDLIRTNRGIIEVYQTAGERLENESHSEMLQDSAEQHETFVTELSNLVVSHSGEPVAEADETTILKQAWVTLKSTITEGDAPILSEVAQDAETVVEEYKKAKDEDLPEDVQKVINRQLEEIRQASEKLSNLSETE